MLMAHDSDAFTRWEAGQRLAVERAVGRWCSDHAAGRSGGASSIRAWSTAFAASLDRAAEDPAFAARALSLPSSGYLGQQMAVIDVEGIRHALDHARDATRHARCATAGSPPTARNRRRAVLDRDRGHGAGAR